MSTPLPPLLRRTRFLFLASLVSSAALTLPAFAGDVSWTLNAPGSWTVPANWSSNPNLPGPNDDVTIDRPGGDFLVSLTGSAQSIQSLIAAEPLAISSGTLTTTNTLQFNNSFALSNATLVGGTLTAGPAASFNITSATFSNLTLASGPFSVAGSLTLLNNLSFSNSTLIFNANQLTLNIPGVQTLSGTGTIALTPVANNLPGTFSNLSAGTLTIASGITITSYSVSQQETLTASTLTNLGTIEANSQLFSISASNVFINTGTLKVESLLSIGATLTGSGGHIQLLGGRLSLSSPLTGSQLITFDAGGILQTNSSSLTLPSGTTTRVLSDNAVLAAPLCTNQGAIFLDSPGKTLLLENWSASSATPGGTLISSGSISGPGNITFTGASSISGTFAVTGTTTINSGASLSFAPGTYLLNTLLIPSGTGGTFAGKLNLASSKLIFQPATPDDKSVRLPQLRSYLAAGSANNWTGNGITSSAAAADPTHSAIALLDNALLHLSTFGGQPVDANSILLALAHIGDANANGIVDIQDQSLITNHWQSAQSSWTAGDLNLDGFVDIQDLTLVTSNWQQTSAFSQIPITSYTVPTISTPEPISLFILIPSFLWLHTRKARFSALPSAP